MLLTPSFSRASYPQINLNSSSGDLFPSFSLEYELMCDIIRLTSFCSKLSKDLPFGRMRLINSWLSSYASRKVIRDNPG